MWDHLPRKVQEQIIDQEAEVLRHRRLRGGQGDRHGRPHQHHHADLLLRHQRRAAARGGHRRDQARHQEDLRQARRGGRAARTSRPWTNAGPTCTKCGCPPGVASTFDLRPAVPAEAPEFVQKVTAEIIAGRRRRACRSAPCRSTAPSPPARRQWEKRNIALEIPVWDAEHLHPVRQVRAGLPARRHPRQGLRRRAAGRRARDVQIGPGALEGIRRPALHPPGGAGRLHRLRAVRRGLPGQEQERDPAQGHQHGAAAAAARARERQLGVLPELARS